MLPHPKLIYADRFQGESRDWAGGNPTTETNVSYVASSKFGVAAELGTASLPSNISYPPVLYSNEFSLRILFKPNYLGRALVVGDLADSGARGHGLQLGSSSAFLFWVATSSTGLVRVQCNYNNNDWNDVVCVAKVGEPLRVYIDSELCAEGGSNLTSMYSNTLNFMIGTRPSVFIEQFTGKIADFQLWDVALQQSDIIRVMQGKHPISI